MLATRCHSSSDSPCSMFAAFSYIAALPHAYRRLHV